MNAERIKELVDKYNAMVADPAEIKEIEQLLERGEIDLQELGELHAIESGVSRMEAPLPSLRLDDSFYAMLKREKASSTKHKWQSIFSWPELAPRLAFASVTLLIGLIAGFLLRSPVQKNEQIRELGQEVTDLKELVMLSLLEKESATDRLKAVNLTHEMDQASHKVTKALLETINNDENVNVRLAALDALKGYSNDSKVREELIRSIARQESPLVQIALAELMVTLQAKSSVKALEKILHDKNTPVDVRKKMEESIRVLI